MRRGTVSAELFGSLVRAIRVHQTKKPMREVAEPLGVFNATISQVEKGQRALKEERIEKYAIGLGVDPEELLYLWNACQGYLPDNRRKKLYFCPDQTKLRHKIQESFRRLAPDVNVYVDIPEIEPPHPIVRNRGKSVTKSETNDILQTLTAQELNRVMGYIQALIDSREIPEEPSQSLQEVRVRLNLGD